MKKNITKRIPGIAIPLAILIMGISSAAYGRAHTITLSGTGLMKSEQIQPVSGRVKVTGTSDTAVVFTDVESGEAYTIGYITPGMGGSIQLERGKWYRVEGAGELTVRLINVRIE